MKSLEGTKSKNSLLTIHSAAGSNEKTIVVLGVERGGTSMVAGMIRALGVDMGGRAGRNHEDPRFLTDDRDVLLARIKENNSNKGTWGFKVPKASLMLDFYDKHLRNPHYVLVFRNLEAIVDRWCSRGANDPMQSALHAMKYYDAALNFFREKKRPLVFASYERACDNPEEFARALSEFLEADSSEEDIQKAVSIVTGEGGGYLDLPEYYFHIDALDFDSWPQNELECTVDCSNEALFTVSDKKVGDRLIVKPEGEYFPKEFYLGFELLGDDTSLLSEQGLRVYMDFTDTFFPGHAFRPPIRQGKNLLKLSNNGNVRRVALGGLRSGYKFGFGDVKCFSEAEISDSDFAIVSANMKSQPSSIGRRVIRKLRSILIDK